MLISDITIFPCYGAQRQERSTKIYGYYSQEFNFQRATIITWTHLKNGELEISKDRHAKVRFVYTERRNKELKGGIKSLQSATRGIKFPNKIMVTRNARWPENITWPPPWTTTQLGPLQYQVMGLLGFNPQFLALENWAATRLNFLPCNLGGSSSSI